ncbi:NnrS family protein [Methylobacter tundripaludum]|uniref:NnrS family protein n=1 Tax=Methylobacter tundripaludum (strain ATCC BAA-1195 / DSM 17260 / SV96) TaxID=697282 RepID=G3IRY5_METTV|nr:NnrS family protein [Methylobacter tundripaludum]EGW22196.1 NnrS family protein [Methylobacter tundripaludum SV96]
MKSQPIFDYPLFALGFRAFFALAGLAALILIVFWNAIFNGTLTSEHYYPNNYWHAHEMLLGYAVAVIAGFLLTAVKNWTGKPTSTGDQLASLCLLWLYGRILPFYAGLLPDALIALVDFAFLPALAYQVSKPIIEAKQYRNLFFIGLIMLLALGNGLIHAEMLGLQENTATIGIQLVVATIIILILIIAGRVFPFFTERGIPGTLIIRNPLLDNASVASAVIVFALQIFGISGTLLALAAIVAVAVNVARLSDWYVQRVMYVPLLWVLYAGYGWIILGFMLTVLSAYSVVLPSLALHAFTLGGIGVLTLGMMARVSLGHTGRAMKASNTMAIAFVLINVAALFRVLLPIAMPHWYENLIYVSTLSWLAAFSLFVFVYAPILSSARIDGQDG